MNSIRLPSMKILPLRWKNSCADIGVIISPPFYNAVLFCGQSRIFLCSDKISLKRYRHEKASERQYHIVSSWRLVLNVYTLLTAVSIFKASLPILHRHSNIFQILRLSKSDVMSLVSVSLLIKLLVDCFMSCLCQWLLSIVNYLFASASVCRF